MAICPDVGYSIFWFLIWLLFTWPLAFFVAILEVFIVPFCACVESAKKACEVLDNIFKMLAYQPIDNMIYGRPIVQLGNQPGSEAMQKQRVPTDDSEAI